MRQVRQEVVPKLKFQNSFDTGPKPRLPKAKEHDKNQPTQVRVAEYRTSKEAQAKVAELNKKGVKATLKKTTDSKGTLYIVYKPTSPAPPGGEKVVQKPEKSSGATPQTQSRIALPRPSWRQGSAAGSSGGWRLITEPLRRRWGAGRRPATSRCCPAPRRTPDFSLPRPALHPEPDDPQNMAGVWRREPGPSPARAIA